MALALVTGANRGLGFETCRQLIQRGWNVLLAARDSYQGKRAAADLGEAAAVVHLDLEQPASIEALARSLANGPRLDALVNNAGASFDGLDENVARRTLDINLHGPQRLTDALLPSLAESANIVMVSSGMGELSHVSKSLQEQLLDSRLQRRDIEVLATAFIAAVSERRPEREGFPSNAYSVSKVLLNAFTRVLARELSGTQRRVNAVCPGWVSTRMGGAAAPRSVEHGARTIVWAATLGSSGPQGGFFRDEKAVDW